MFIETTRDTRVIGFTRPVARVDDNVDPRQFTLMMPKRLAHQTLDAIAPHCIADDARRDRQAEPRCCRIVVTDENGEQRVSATARMAIYPIEFGLVAKTLRRRERSRRGLQIRVRLCARTAAGSAL